MSKERKYTLIVDLEVTAIGKGKGAKYHNEIRFDYAGETNSLEKVAMLTIVRENIDKILQRELFKQGNP